MPNTHSTLDSLFRDIAQAIRDKKGESASVTYVADDFPTAIAAIPTGRSVSLSNCTRSFNDYSELRFGQGLASVLADLTPTSDVKYFLAIVEAFYEGSGQYDNTQSGYAFALADSDMNTIVEGHGGTCEAITTSKRMQKLRILGIVHAHPASTGQKALVSIYELF